jgi:hypothetical protein
MTMTLSGPIPGGTWASEAVSSAPIKAGGSISPGPNRALIHLRSSTDQTSSPDAILAAAVEAEINRLERQAATLRPLRQSLLAMG